MEGFNIYYQNCRGLRTKKDQFFANFIGCDYDILCLTETGFNDKCQSYNYFTENYYVFRKDKARPVIDVDVRGGGTVIAVKKTFQVHRRFDLDYNNIECTWVEIKLNHELTLLIGNHYFHPRIETNLLQNYSDFISDAVDISMYKIICVGDYNMPEFNWDIGRSENANSYIRNKSDVIYSMFCNLNLVQHNTVRINAWDNLLDLVCSNFSDELTICPETCLVPLDYQHPSLLISCNIPCYNKFFSPITKKDYAKGDYGGLFHYVSNYEYINSSNDPDVLVHDLNSAITGAIHEFIPNKIISPSKYPHWFSYRLRNLLKLKEKFHKKFKKSPFNLYFKESFQNFRKLVKIQFTSDEKRYKHRVENDLRQNPKFFWRYCKTQYKQANEISIVVNNQVVPDETVPHVFAEHFSSIYSSARNVGLVGTDGNSYDGGDGVGTSHGVPGLVPPMVTVNDVVKAAKSLKHSPIAGVDNIPSFVVKGCIHAIAPVLCNIFNICLSLGKFPNLWKTAIVVPVPKTSNVNDYKSYRPISLLPNFSKLFEKIIVDHISCHVKNFLSPHQHGFVQGRSTVTNLVSFLQFTTPAVIDRLQVDTIYFDLSKAFDLVDHDKLLQKLVKFGLSPAYVAFFEAYLKCRKFCVKYGKFLSLEQFIPSGVPQGSNLGPILFIVFFDDIKHCLNGHFEIFADDLKISRIIREPDDALLLQNDVDSVLQWCNGNGMQCNVSKTVVVSFSRKHTTDFHAYTLAGNNILRKFVQRDLGVLMDSKLNFGCHVQRIISSARKSSGIIYWTTKHFRNPSTYTVLYCALVRSRLEYCSEVWNSIGVTEASRIEQVQKTCLRRVTFRALGRSSSYNDALTMYQLTKLSLRRTHRDIVLLFKIISCIFNCPYLVPFVRFNVPRLNARRVQYFRVARNTMHKMIPLSRAMTISNQYSELDFSITLSRFLSRVQEIVL